MVLNWSVIERWRCISDVVSYTHQATTSASVGPSRSRNSGGCNALSEWLLTMNASDCCWTEVWLRRWGAQRRIRTLIMQQHLLLNFTKIAPCAERIISSEKQYLYFYYMHGLRQIHRNKTQSWRWKRNPENTKRDPKIHQKIIQKSLKIVARKHLGAVLGGLARSWEALGLPGRPGVFQKTTIFFANFPPRWGPSWSRFLWFSWFFWIVFRMCFWNAIGHHFW